MKGHCTQLKRRAALWSALPLVAVVLMACGPRQEGGVPTDLQGRWITAEARYRDRYLEIRSDRLIWGVGEFELDSHPIEKVESRPADDRQTHYWLHYTETQGYPHALEVLLHRGSRLALRFPNRPETWLRAPAG
jgi:hypothetical protein